MIKKGGGEVFSNPFALPSSSCMFRTGSFDHSQLALLTLLLLYERAQAMGFVLGLVFFLFFFFLYMYVRYDFLTYFPTCSTRTRYRNCIFIVKDFFFFVRYQFFFFFFFQIYLYKSIYNKSLYLTKPNQRKEKEKKKKMHHPLIQEQRNLCRGITISAEESSLSLPPLVWNVFAVSMSYMVIKCLPFSAMWWGFPRTSFCWALTFYILLLRIGVVVCGRGRISILALCSLSWRENVGG